MRSIFNKKTIRTSNLLILFLIILVVSACHRNKDLAEQENIGNINNINNDCSMVFATSPDNPIINDYEMKIEPDQIKNITRCKVLPLQINNETKCEISGSDKIDNFLDFYSQNPDGRVLFRAPLKALVNSDDISYKDMIKYYFLIQKIKSHIDSDLFTSLKDFHYKGVSCDVKGNKFASWFNDEEIMIIYADNKKVDKKPDKKSGKANDKKPGKKTGKKANKS